MAAPISRRGLEQPRELRRYLGHGPRRDRHAAVAALHHEVLTPPPRILIRKVEAPVRAAALRPLDRSAKDSLAQDQHEAHVPARMPARIVEERAGRAHP